MIVNYNGAAFVADAVTSALHQSYNGRVETIVVDNASTDSSLTLLRQLRGIQLIENSTNGGFGAGANIALGASEADYIAFLNPDAIAKPQWLERIISWMSEADIDIASSMISAGSETWFARGRFFEILGSTLVERTVAGVTDWVSGCALVGKRSALELLGGFDEEFFLYYEDVDLSLRARLAGLRIGVFAETLVDHPEDGRSTGALGNRKAEIGYFSRGRLIGKHVRGWRRLTALTFGATVSPIRNGVRGRSLIPVIRSLIAGFASARTRAERP